MSPASEAVIVCDRLTVAYGEEVILRGVSLEVRRGEFLPVVGPNGAGKTTLLRAILGLVRPRSGRIVTPFARQPAGYVPQHKAIDPLYPVNVRQIVGMGLYPRLGWRRRATPADRALVQAALEEMGLADHAHKTFAELSGGMKQKAFIARAFASGAEIFIMDEPTSELDHASEREVIQTLHRLCVERGKTVLMAQHGLDLVTKLAPELWVVSHGCVRRVAAKEYLEKGDAAVHSGPTTPSLLER